MPWEIACFTLAILAVSTLLGLCYVVAQSNTLAWKVYEASCIVSRSQQEASTKYVTAMAQTANLLSERIDSRVAQRVKMTNTLLRGPKGDAAGEEIEEAPPPPDVFQAGYVNDLSEIQRELTRMRRDDEEYPVREVGIGAAEDV